MNRFVLVVLLCGLLVVSTARAARRGSPHREDSPRIGVLSFSSPQLGPAAVATIPSQVAEQLRQKNRAAVVVLNELTTALSRRGVTAESCSRDTACLMSLASDLDLDAIVTGELEQVDRLFVLTISLTRMDDPGHPVLAPETMRRVENLSTNVKLCMAELDRLGALQLKRRSSPDIPLARPTPPPAVVAPIAPVRPDRPQPTPPREERRLPPGRVLVLEARSAGAEGNIVAELPELVAEVIADHPGFDVASQEEVRSMLQLDREKQLLGCTEDSSCVAEITKKLNADYLVTTSLGRLGQTYLLTMALIDSRAPNQNRRVSDSFDGPDALKAGLRGTVENLFGLSRAQPAPKFRLPSGKPSSFAVFDLQAKGVPPEVAMNLTQIVSTEVKGIQGTSVVSRDDIVALLQFDKEKVDLGCTEDTACMASIGGMLGVDRLVVGHVGRVADDYVIALRLIDARRAQVESRATESFRGGEDQLIGATRHAVRQLLGLEENSVGRIAVTSSHPAAQVFLDNEQLGIMPLPPIDNLRPGRHNVRLAKEGFFDWQSDVYVRSSETTVAWAQLRERPAKWYQLWWVWTAAGVVVAGTAAGILVATRSPTAGSGVVSWQPSVTP